MIAFIRGIRTPLRTTWMRASVRMVSNRAGVLSVAFADQEPHGAARAFEVHDEVLRGLGDPGGGRVRGGADDADPAAAVFDDREYVQAGAAQGEGLEEVAGQQGVSLWAKEGRPGGGGALGRGIDASVLEDLPDSGGGDLDAEYE
ncbi:hypothetical protein [Saccharothrix deserti]|uniref:hypothetical protein n=1 Tax=Saccharothrix deserti TaxID=2593674 RepID=UPI00131CF1D7|nr:hypothetical protein [Saccharothrix deserti]